MLMAIKMSVLVGMVMIMTIDDGGSSCHDVYVYEDEAYKG
jgi:hypothetical protein